MFIDGIPEESFFERRESFHHAAKSFQAGSKSRPKKCAQGFAAKDNEMPWRLRYNPNKRREFHHILTSI